MSVRGFCFLFQPTLIKAINNHPGVLLTSYEGLRINAEDLLRYRWDYVILDEGHKIRNPDSKVTLACKKVLVLLFVVVRG